MNKLIILFLLVAVILTIGCSANNQISADNRVTIMGSSNLVSQHIEVSDFSAQEFGGSHVLDQPLWALEQNALIYPDSPFWVVPLDGSPAFVPQTPGGEEPMNLPRPFGSLWSSHLNQLVGNVDSGPGGGFGGVWVYQLSEDLNKIESFYRIGEFPSGDNSFITLVDWWSVGESILVLDGDNPDTDQYLSEIWRGPAIWSLADKQWINNSSD
jgi:hypothetical protein